MNYYNIFSVYCQAELFFFHYLPHVYESVPHSAKSSINTDISNIGYLFKTETRIMPQDHYLFLIIGKLPDQHPYILLYLAFNEIIFDIYIRESF